MHPSPISIMLGLLAGVFTLTLYFRFLFKKRRPAPLPPGPRGLPLLGNIADLPQSQPWVGFSKLGQEYGGIVYLNVLGRSIIIINDARYALEMLDNKSRIYSERPVLVMAGQLVGWDQGPALIQTGKKWGEYRRLFAQVMGTRSKVERFNDVMEEETHAFLGNILSNPKSWVQHSRKFAGAVVLKIAYGYKASDADDPMVALVDEAMDQFSETTATNAFMVDVFPILSFVPEWFPGAAWKKKASRYRQTLQTMLDTPYNWAKKQMIEGTARSSFISSTMDNQELTPEQAHVIKWTAAGIYSGGADTTVGAIESFILAMTFQREAQQKAYSEIVAVLGAGVLPTLADRPRLPYVEALLTEILRTYTFGPIGLPHVPTEDDVHDGYFIPSGSIIFTNVWQFFRDSNTYKDPELFLPERFIIDSVRTKEKDPRDYLFGFGRRRCPGIHLAEASMWLACVAVLAAFDIQPPIKDGKPVFPSGKYMDGSISHPEPFECTILPRVGAREAIHRALGSAN